MKIEQLVMFLIGLFMFIAGTVYISDKYIITEIVKAQNEVAIPVQVYIYEIDTLKQ